MTEVGICPAVWFWKLPFASTRSNTQMPFSPSPSCTSRSWVTPICQDAERGQISNDSREQHRVTAVNIYTSLTKDVAKVCRGSKYCRNYSWPQIINHCSARTATTDSDALLKASCRASLSVWNEWDIYDAWYMMWYMISCPLITLMPFQPIYGFRNTFTIHPFLLALSCQLSWNKSIFPVAAVSRHRQGNYINNSRCLSVYLAYTNQTERYSFRVWSYRFWLHY